MTVSWMVSPASSVTIPFSGLWSSANGPSAFAAAVVPAVSTTSVVQSARACCFTKSGRAKPVLWIIVALLPFCGGG